MLTAGGLTATVLPDKGADICSLIDERTGIELLCTTPWGLQPPGSPPREGSGGHAFLENYEGGWQELFPNTNDPCTYRGRALPFHGEVATVPWRWEEVDGGDGVAVRFAVDCERSPLRLERTMRLPGDRPRLELDEVAHNLGNEDEQVVWGHHCVLGAPLVAAGARLRLPARTLITIPEMWEDTARLAPGQRSAWPAARLRSGGTTDLSVLPGPNAGSHDDVYLTDLDGGWAEVENIDVGLRFRLEWDPAVFRWVISWQPFGGAQAMPLAGAYGLGVEPWVAGGNLAAAVAEGAALTIPAGGSMATTLAASTEHPGDG